MTATVCPYLGLLEDPEAHLNYASFENRCYATVARESIPLSEQGVFCLGGNYKSCPRFMALHGPPQSESTIETRPLPPPYVAAEEEVDLVQAYVPAPVYPPPVASTPTRDWSLAVILGGIIMGIFLCVSAVAGYFSLRALVTTTLPATPSELPIVVVSLTPTPTGEMPVTLTPTPTATAFISEPSTPSPVGTDTPIVIPPTATPFETAIVPTSTSFPTPTRRPPPTTTPYPTSTPFPTSTPRGTFTATPPAVNITFTASKTSIIVGDCTLIAWNVTNAQAVYYEDVGVAGRGSSEECPIKTSIYTLRVIDLYNNTTKKTITVTVGQGTPSPTPTVTATWTPWPTPTPSPTITPTRTRTPTPTASPTPTITPTATIIPSPSPTPFYVQWRAVPSSYDGTGSAANISFVNDGSGPDALFLRLDKVSVPSGWSVAICFGSDCSATQTSPSTGSGSSFSTTVRFSFPNDAPSGQTGSATLRGISTLDSVYSIGVPITVRVP